MTGSYICNYLPLRLQFFAMDHSQGRVAFLPFAPIMLKSLKRKDTVFEPQTVGEHIKKRRFLLKLIQKAVGGILKVSQL